MSQQIVEQIIGRLVMDQDFRQRVTTDRDAALSEFDLTQEERTNFANMDLQEFNASVAGLDERVSKGGGYTAN